VLAGAGGAVAAWVGAAIATPGHSRAGTAVRTAAGRLVRLSEHNSAVWAWHVLVHGRADGPATLTVDGIPTAVESDGKRFESLVPLHAGDNLVVAKAGGDAAKVTYEVPMAARPRAVAAATVDGDEIVLDATASAPSQPTEAALVSWRWAQRGGADLVGLPADGATVKIARPSGPGPWYVDMWLTDSAGETDRSGVTLLGSADGATGGAVPAEPEESAPWVADAIVYGIVPWAFGYSGFRDIRLALPRLQKLGVTTLWMSPVFGAERYEFGYGVTDYFRIRNDYGGREQLERLIEAAHGRGMRVLFDIAANHTSNQHRYFRQAERYGARSHQWDYYQRDENGDHVYYFDWENLPNLNFDNVEVRRWIAEAMTYWMRELDIDGYRFDAAWGIRERNPDVWPELIAEMRRTKPDALLLAEASSKDEYYFEVGFDLSYDWTNELGHWAWEKVFEEPDQIVAALDDRVGLAPEQDVFRWINNNDTGERFIDRYGLELTQVAVALLFTLPGVPTLYTGDEVGASLDPYETYEPIDWTTYPELTAWYTRVIRVRSELPELTSAPFQRVSVTPADVVYAFSRGDVLVLLNFSAADVEVELTEPVSAPMLDRLNGEAIPAGPIPMPAYGARVLTPEGAA